MRTLETVGSEGAQQIIITFLEEPVTIKLRFLSVVEMWIMDVTYGENVIQGVRLSVGVGLLISRLFPFDFIVQDTTANGQDPFQKTDFSTGRCVLYFLEPEEADELRGFPVAV